MPVVRHKRGVPVDGIGHLRIVLSDAAYIGPGRADLLELIDETGSISRAAGRMGMSYKRAWDLVQALNAGFGTDLVQTSRGGAEQGASVTPIGRQVLAAYRLMQQKAAVAVEADLTTLRALLRTDPEPK